MAALALVVILCGTMTTPAVGAEKPVSTASSGDSTVDDLPYGVDQFPWDPEFWRKIRRGKQGETNLQDPKAATPLQQSGQQWREFQTETLPGYGKWGIGGIFLLLVAIYLIRGPVRLQSWFSGNVILRFNSIERIAHWMLAISFIVLALTGLNILYGRDVVKPLIGPTTFAEFTAIGKWLHDYTGFAFFISLAFVGVLWARDNVPRRHDLNWPADAGGLSSSDQIAPAGRFGAGQKLVYWFVILSGLLISLTGLCLLFPFALSPLSGALAAMGHGVVGLPSPTSLVGEMQVIHAIHGILGITMIVVMLVHAYTGTIGTEGTLEGMTSGYVDENWIREHHPLLARELGLDLDHDDVAR